MPSFEKLKKKSGIDWTVRFRINDGGEVRRIRLSGNKTKADAETAYHIYRTQHPDQFERTRVDADRPVLFGDLIDRFLSNRQKNGSKESGYITAASKINTHIRPAFEKKKISAITPSQILTWQNETISGYSYSYRTSLRQYLNSIFIFGERYYEIHNVAKKVEMPRRPAEDYQKAAEPFRVWTLDQCGDFLSSIESKHSVYYHLYKTLYVTGMRKGEALALDFEDIDPAGKIRISKSLTRKTKDAPYKITPPKTPTSNRTIQAPPELCRDLLLLRTGPEDHFVFGGTYPLADSTITRYFKRYISKSGVPPIKIHELRHSCASLLISHGVSIVAVSHHLGHKSIEETLKTYAHLMPSDEDQIRSSFAYMSLPIR